jgi:murein L,D-transpeptidase YcbB/YkuD
MPGVRLDRFLASTAVVLLLSGAAGSALAEPKADSSLEVATPAATPSTTDQSAQSGVKPGESAGEATEPAAAKPQASSDESAQGAAASAASNPSSAQSSEAPAKAPAAAAGDEAPTATVAAPAVAPPNDSAAAATALSAVVNADTVIADQLRELSNGKFDRVVGKKERAGIDAFYSGRNYAPLWITDGKPNTRATAAIAYLSKVDADGLDAADYPVPDFASLSDPAALAEAELRLTASVVAYAHHAQVGRVHWTRVSSDIFYDQKPPAPAEVLATMADATDVAAALDAYEPHHPAYLALKAKLAELRAGKTEAGADPIPNGPTLKLGMQDTRVPQLRERLGVRGDGTAYDKALAEAVKTFQTGHDLKATGMLTPGTVEALNGRAPDRPADIIIANLERWRWMPHDLGNTHVMVNLADFTLKVMHDGNELWKTRIVDGKPNMATPIMTAEMKYITVNPTWNVPPSIVAKEYMPVLQQDPTALERIGLMVSTNPDGTVHISQPPGEKNALGRLRFNFPNKFLVYQHDTPEKHLFAFDKRAFSHGCMRVQDPVKYAEVLLSLVRPHDGYTEDRIRKMFGESEVDIPFPTFVPVHLTYQTAFVDEDGKLEFRDDVYGRDKALLAILKSDERKVADTPVERKDNVVNRELLAMPDQFGWGRGGFGGNFFSRLFGAPAFQPAPSYSRRHAAQRRPEIQ